MYIRRQY